MSGMIDAFRIMAGPRLEPSRAREIHAEIQHYSDLRLSMLAWVLQAVPLIAIGLGAWWSGSASFLSFMLAFQAALLLVHLLGQRYKANQVRCRALKMANGAPTSWFA